MSEFKKIKLDFDEERYNKSLATAEDKAVEYNDKLERVSEFLDMQLTAKDVVSILSNPMQFVDSYLTPAFQFPQASKEFNLQSMGRLEEYNTLVGVVQGLGLALWNSYGFDYVKGAVVVPEQAKEVIRERFTRYTQSDKQNDVYHEALKVAEGLNNLIDAGVLDRMRANKISNSFPMLTVVNDGKGFKIVIHAASLLNIN